MMINLPLEKLMIARFKLGVIDFEAGGYDFSFGVGEKYLHVITLGNLALLKKRGIKWERVLFFAVPNRHAWSICVIGKDKYKSTIVYNRRETESSLAGQTKLYYEGRYPIQVSEIIREGFKKWQKDCRKRLKLGGD